MQRINKIVQLLFIAVGRRYEALTYKDRRDEQRARYGGAPYVKPPDELDLYKIKMIMHHVSEIRKILKNGR